MNSCCIREGETRNSRQRRAAGACQYMRMPSAPFDRRPVERLREQLLPGAGERNEPTLGPADALRDGVDQGRAASYGQSFTVNVRPHRPEWPAAVECGLAKAESRHRPELGLDRQRKRRPLALSRANPARTKSDRLPTSSRSHEEARAAGPTTRGGRAGFFESSHRWSFANPTLRCTFSKQTLCLFGNIVRPKKVRVHTHVETEQSARPM